ncbi:hypothetical protein DFS33DRAFT_490165 [Desarmillaria ectypa]|nr:hypothetical protein DFS33DRAFT_490165 [Desarmillaria ectypa]
MQSLAEMRPKIVELTGTKLELSEKVDSLEATLRSREATIAQLEATLDEDRDQKEQAELKWSEILARHEKERLSEQEASNKIQKAFTEMQDELESALASIRALEAERSGYHHDAARQLQEIEHLNQSTVVQAQELAALRQEIAERNNIRVRNQFSSVVASSQLLYHRKRKKSLYHRPRVKSKVSDRQSRVKTRRLSVSSRRRIPRQVPRALARLTTRCWVQLSSSILSNSPLRNQRSGHWRPRFSRQMPARTHCRNRSMLWRIN